MDVNARRVLIASANSLFGKGLEKLLVQKHGSQKVTIRLVSSMQETLQILSDWQPDLVILDYDDHTIDKTVFLNRFVSGESEMRVLLASLQSGGTPLIYDRRMVSSQEAEEWLGRSLQDFPDNPDKAGEKKDGGMRHYLIVSVLVGVFTVLTYLFLTNAGLLPVQASSQAILIDELFDVHLFLISFFFSLIGVFLVYSLVVFRRKTGEMEDGKYFTGSSKLEVIWTVVPLGIVLYLSFIGSKSLAEVSRVDPQALEVNVTAGQWFWRFEYPDNGITSQSLNLPVNRQVLLKMTSLDVIHSFWVPEFRVKQDVLPGKNLVKELRFTPTVVGDYTVMCAELCGGAHAYMNAPVKVMEVNDFDNWVDQELATSSSDPAVRGQKFSTEKGCIGCHSLDDKPSVGPGWKGLFGKEEILTDGTVVVVDEVYLRTSIFEPNLQVPKDYPANVMPSTYKDLLNEQQVEDIIAFIKTLQ